jgi:DNA-binding CsgD family transcriptional regulator
MPGEVDPLLRARGLALAAFWGGTYAAELPVREHGDEAVALARGLGDVEALKGALSGAARTRYQYEPYEAIGYDTELVELARRDGDAHAAALATAGIGIALLSSWEVANALPYLRAAVAELAVTGPESDWAQAQAVLGVVLSSAGHLDEAVEIARSTLPRTGPTEPARWLVLTAGSFALGLRGDVVEAADMAHDLIEVGRRVGLTQPLVMGCYSAARAALAGGDAALAVHHLETALSTKGWWFGSVAGDRIPVFSLSIADCLVAASLVLGDRVRAARRAAELIAVPPREQRGLHAVVTMTRARIAAADGDLGVARDLAADALTVSHGLGNRLQALDCLDLLVVIAAADGRHADVARLLAVVDAERARLGAPRFAADAPAADAAVTAASNALGSEIDAVRSRARSVTVDDLVAELGRPQRGRAAYGWDSLTPSELDVVRLIGEGMSNKEIAARLFISPRTVQAHLSHVYRKLQVRSRLELARDLAGRT